MLKNQLFTSETDNGMTFYRFKCDDANGFILTIIRGLDGDLHIQIEPDPSHENFVNNLNQISGSVRLRVPIIGGGNFEHLYDALVSGLQKEVQKNNILTSG